MNWRGEYQIPVVSERQHCFFLSCDFHFAKSHCSSKILLVKGAQTGGVEILFQDSVLLTEVHGVDLVTVHQVDHGQLRREALHSGGQGEDGLRRLGQQEVHFGEGQREWMELEQPEYGVGRGHWYVK